jgi:hypothetical protein
VRCTTTPSPGVAYSPPPNWLSLLLVSLPSPRGRRSLILHPLTPSIRISRLKKKCHRRATTLLFPLFFCPPQKSIHRTKCMAMKAGRWRRKSPQDGTWRRTFLSLVRTRKWSGLTVVQIDSRRRASNLSLKFRKNKMISCTHNTSSAKYWTFCSMCWQTLLRRLDS